MNIDCELLIVNLTGYLTFDLKIITPLEEMTIPLSQLPLPVLGNGGIDFNPVQYTINPEFLLTVESSENMPTFPIKIDNTNYQVDYAKPIRLALTPGVYKIEVPEFISESSFMRFTFLG